MSRKKRDNRSNNNSNHVPFVYRCEECRSKFSLPTKSLKDDPYPRIEGSPYEEVIHLCFKCRSTLDRAFMKNFEI